MKLRFKRSDVGVSLPPLPESPSVVKLPTAKLMAAGRYLGTTAAGSDVRVTGQGLAARNSARIQLSVEGVDVVRLGGAFRIPTAALRGARSAEAFAGKTASVLVIKWEHGGHLLDTGFALNPQKSLRSSVSPKTPQPLTELHRDWVRSIGKIARNK